MTNKSLTLSWLLSCPGESCPRLPRHLCGLGPAVLQVVTEKWCVSASSLPCLLGFPSAVVLWPCVPPARVCVQLPLLGCARAGSCWAGAREKLSSGRSCGASSLPPGAAPSPALPRRWSQQLPVRTRVTFPCVNSKAPSYPRNVTLAAAQLGTAVAWVPASQLQLPPGQRVWGGRCSWAGIARCPPGCDTHQAEKVLGAQISLLIVHPTSMGALMGQLLSSAMGS